jgi:hypothetical protein
MFFGDVRFEIRPWMHWVETGDLGTIGEDCFDEGLCIVKYAFCWLLVDLGIVDS